MLDCGRCIDHLHHILGQALSFMIAAIGVGLSDGVQLVYQSGGVAQAPWSYDSVRVSVRGDYDRCVVVFRTAMPARESCARGDTLFERQASGAFSAARPIGPAMRLDVPLSGGRIMRYETATVAPRVIGTDTIEFVLTTIITHDSTGTPVRMLREQYAPALLTALSGAFEEPDSTGRWRVTRQFELAGIQRRQ